MKVTLDYIEIIAALADALEKKTQHVHGTIHPDDCFFEEIEGFEDISRLEFSTVV